jgi:hypothetical protein
MQRFAKTANEKEKLLEEEEKGVCEPEMEFNKIKSIIRVNSSERRNRRL